MVLSGRYFRGVIWGTFLFCFSISVYANVFGFDARTEANFKSGPYQMLGKIFLSDGTCTGAMIGPDLVLTNLHCVNMRIGREPELPVFKSSYRWTSYKYSSRAIDVIYDHQTQFRFGAGGELDTDVRDDWAILVLREPIGLLTGWFRVAPQSEIKNHYVFNSKNVSLAGYSGDRAEGEVLTTHENCEIKKLGYFRVLHNCDMGPGASGGPLWRVIGQNVYEIVALNESMALTPRLALAMSLKRWGH